MDTVVVITGASSGIGAALAEQLAAAGASVALAARREPALREVAARCPSADRVLVVAADVTRRSEVERIASETIDYFGRIDVWVNNAGRGITRMPSLLTDEDVDVMMQVNVKAALYGLQAVLPHFKARGSGHVINVSSLLGRVPFAVARSSYSASKHFLNALTAMLREEIQQTHPGVQISLVSPGVVLTDFGNSALYGGVDSRTLPGGQTAEEVAAAIVKTIGTRQPDVYTRPGSKAQIAQYYATIGSDVA